MRIEARRHAVKALETMVKALDDDDAKVRLQAANYVMDRAYGKAAQAVIMQGDEDGGPVNVAMRVLFGRD